MIHSIRRWLRGFHLHRDKPKVTDWVIVGLTVLVASAAIISAFLFQGQLTEARIATQHNTESFRIDERAWVEIESVKLARTYPGDSKIAAAFRYEIYPKNVGKTVASDIQILARRGITLNAITMGDQAPQINMLQDRLLLEEPRGPSDIPRINPISKVLAPNTLAAVPLIMNGQAPQVFSNGELVSYLIGRINYTDAFQIKHWLKFCFFVAGARGELWNCKEGNDEDRNEEMSSSILQGERRGETRVSQTLYWTLNHIDRILSFAAIAIAVIAIYDVRNLFRTTEQRARTAILRELNNYGASMCAFYRACQYVEFHPTELDRESAALLFATFRVQQLLAPNATKEELTDLQKSTRKDVDKKAREYMKLLISSDIGKLKDGWTLPKDE